MFTNGVFDLLHPGHVRYLHEARRLGDALIVGVNSDRSVRANKGADSTDQLAPRNASRFSWRSTSVDAAAVFDEDTPLAIITLIQPDILVKGADWGADNIVGRDVVERRGGRVVRVELAKGFSTTGLIGKMRPAPSMTQRYSLADAPFPPGARRCEGRARSGRPSHGRIDGIVKSARDCGAGAKPAGRDRGRRPDRHRSRAADGRHPIFLRRT